MNSQDIRNLQEAYIEVVKNQQLDEEEQSSMPLRRSAAQRKKRAKELGDRQTIRGIVTAHNKKRQPPRQEDPEKYYPKEQYDLYDIILSHLLDEGYAETPEAAEAIMVNMGEEWRESIVEGGFNSSGRYDVGGGRTVGPVAGAVRSLFSGNLPKGRTYVPPSPQKGTNRPPAVPASRDDSGRLTTYGAGGGAAAEARGQTRPEVMQQGAKNLENKKRLQPVNQGPDFGR